MSKEHPVGITLHDPITGVTVRSEGFVSLDMDSAGVIDSVFVELPMGDALLQSLERSELAVALTNHAASLVGWRADSKYE